MTDIISTLVFLGMISIAILLYFLPTIIAMCYNTKRMGAICVLNFFLGWTLLGWIGGLIWAIVEAESK